METINGTNETDNASEHMAWAEVAAEKDDVEFEALLEADMDAFRARGRAEDELSAATAEAAKVQIARVDALIAANAEAAPARAREMDALMKRVSSEMEALAADMAALDRFSASQGLRIPGRPPLPFLVNTHEDFMLEIGIFGEELKNIDLKGDKAQEWVACRARIHTRLKAINDERAIAHEAKAAEARAECERREAERDHALNELAAAQRKVTEAAAAVDQAASQSATLNKLHNKDSAEV